MSLAAGTRLGPCEVLGLTDAIMNAEPAGLTTLQPLARIGRPRPLVPFNNCNLALSCTDSRCCDVATDGEPFCTCQKGPSPPQPPVTHVNLIQDWFEEPKRKVPAQAN